MSPSQDSVSTESRLTRLDRLKVTVGLFVASWLIRALVSSYRVEVVSGQQHLPALIEGRETAVVLGWHDSLLLSGTFLLRKMVRRGLRLTILVSLSRDGEILARLTKKLGFQVVRGSTSRGGLGGLRRLYRMLKHEGVSVGLAPDGPRGPSRRCQSGALLLSQLSSRPLLPIGAATNRFWRIGSWDRMFVPRPFARIAVVIGDPVAVPEHLSGDELSEKSETVASTLDRLTDQALQAL